MAVKTDQELPQRILVIDDDRLLNTQIASLLIDNGAAKVDSAYDGEAGWEMCLGGEYDFLILDWKLPLLSGLALFNRIRGVDRLLGTPVLVVSGLVQRLDFRLLQEFPCTRLLEKPFNHASLLREAVALKKEAQWYARNTERIGEIMDTVKADPDKALRALRTLVTESPNPQPVALLAARKMREAEHIEQAISLLKAILDQDRGCVPAISELGRCLHTLGRYEEALQFLRRADKLSPSNVERISLMGEAELNNTDPKNAKERFAEALRIDQENRRARHGLRVADTLAEMMHRPAGQHIKDTFASLMNTMAVNLAHSGEYSSAVAKYEEAFHFIAGKEASARVAFNVGLAYLRWGKTRESYDWFVESAKRGQGRFTKAEGYVQRLTEQMKASEDAQKAAAEAAKAAQQAAAEAARAADEAARKAAEAAKKGEDDAAAVQHEQPK
jgi:two-component system chemotaxis response regulator CheY